MSTRIKITCPVAAVPVKTGFRAPPGTMIAGLKQVRMEFCAACGGEHIWNGEDAFWEIIIPPEPTFWEKYRPDWLR